MLVFRAEVLKILMKDKDFLEELEKAKDMREVEEIFLKYAKKHNLKVGVVDGWKRKRSKIRNVVK